MANVKAASAPSIKSSPGPPSIPSKKPSPPLILSLPSPAQTRSSPSPALITSLPASANAAAIVTVINFVLPFITPSLAPFRRLGVGPEPTRALLAGDQQLVTIEAEAVWNSVRPD